MSGAGINMHKRGFRHSSGLLCVLAALSASTAFATEAPSLSEFTFDEQTQVIAFLAFFNGKENIDYEITSSSTNTTFTPATTSGSIGFTGGVSAGLAWFITPGGDAIGKQVTITINVSNANGQDTESKCLRVVAGSRGTPSFAEGGFGPCIPTVSEWGLIIMALIGLTGGTFVFARRRVRGASAVV